MSKRTTVVVMAVVLCAGLAHAGIRADLSGDAVVDFQTTMDMPFMTVGNPGNAGELSGEGVGGSGPDRICGRVNYIYNIGKFEVTAGQYTEFLNAVAADDTYGLYNTEMDRDIGPSPSGCNIKRSGSSGSYTYAVAPDWADRPVDNVGWGDGIRFANWLTNGMPTGTQDVTTTEDGSYFLNGGLTDHDLFDVVRKPNARYVVPSEDEWYKAAYHKNDGVTGNFFDYPTGSDSGPSSDLVDPDPGNNANFGWPGSIGSPYLKTEVGEFENSESPYGTFDMGGNVMEWNELLIDGQRGLRGGSYRGSMLSSFRRLTHNPLGSYHDFGFRIAEVPEPATMSLLAIGGLAVLRRRKK